MYVKIVIEDSNVDTLGKISKIELSGETNNISSYVETNTYGSNVLSNSSNIGDKVFLLEESPLDEGYKFSSNYNGYIGTTQSDSEGNVDSFYIYLTGENIKFIKINFDSISNQYATRLLINNVEYENNSYSFSHELPQASNKVTIQILKWNKPNSFVKITSIVTTLLMQFDYKNGLKKINFSNSSNQNLEQPVFGVKSNYGNIELVDKNYQIENLANQNLLNSEKNVRIYFNDNKVGTFLTENFIKEGNIVTIDLKDKLLELQNIIFKKHYYGPTTQLITFFNEVNEMLENNNYVFEETTKNLIVDKLKEISLYRPYLVEECSLWQCLEKISQITMIQFYLNEEDKIKGVIL